jgi:uncharacterized damage-inducible protein DinB
MKRLLAIATAAALVLVASTAYAQNNPLMTSVKAQHDMIKGNILKTASQVPDAVWAFRPTAEVRTFAQLMGHIANANYMICGAAGGTKGPGTDAEKTPSTKAELSKAVAESFAFCDTVIAGLDDTKAMEVVKFFTGPSPRAMVLAFNTSHNNEHYGNLVTYMRLNKIVPPSSQTGD